MKLKSILYRSLFEFIGFYTFLYRSSNFLMCSCIVCVLQDSQVDQYFADGTFPVFMYLSILHTARHGSTELAGVFLGS